MRDIVRAVNDVIQWYVVPFIMEYIPDQSTAKIVQSWSGGVGVIHRGIAPQSLPHCTSPWPVPGNIGTVHVQPMAVIYTSCTLCQVRVFLLIKEVALLLTLQLAYCT